MADKSLRARLGRLFATNVVVRRIAKNRLKAVDTNISLLSENAAFYVFTGSGAATTGAALNSKGNPALTWEKTTSQNFAVDFGFFDNKLTATIDMFSNETQYWCL